MNPALLRRLPWVALAALVFCATGGFLFGVSGPGMRADDDTGSSAESGPAEPRDSAVALQVLGTSGHWGAYAAPEAEVAVPQAPPAPDLEGIARDYRLVGIERGAEDPVALLLPTSSASGETEVIRLKVGQSLADGITLGSIGTDSVGFSTTAGTSTLHLYDGAQP